MNSKQETMKNGAHEEEEEEEKEKEEEEEEEEEKNEEQEDEDEAEEEEVEEEEEEEEKEEKEEEKEEEEEEEEEEKEEALLVKHAETIAQAQQSTIGWAFLLIFLVCAPHYHRTHARQGVGARKQRVVVVNGC